MQSSCQLYWNVVYRILRYLKEGPGKRSYYRPSPYLDIVEYSYADLVGDPIGHRSTTGYCTFIRANLVTWRSKK